jgi:GT2 family glycosyltransferase
MLRVTVVMCVHDQLALTRGCLDSLRATAEPLRVLVIDNGSTDGTADLLDAADYPFPLRIERNETNGPVIAAFNRGATLTDTEYICFLHNDTVLLDPQWLTRMLRFGDADPSVGLMGLYGVRRIRRDGRYVGRTIVHGLAGAPARLDAAAVEVAVVDGVCLLIRRALFDSLGGFDERYGFLHGYDRDLSFAVRETGRRCVAVTSRFVHHGGGTRTKDFALPGRAHLDLAARGAALARFAEKYRHRLPCDVRSLPERVGDWLRARSLA